MKLKKLTKTIGLCGLLLLFSGLSPPAYSGSNCGSDSGLGKLYKDNSSDWWPDLRGHLVVQALAPLSTVANAAALACATTQGQAYFGDGCQLHDDCYDGKVGINMTKTECDNLLLNRWQQSCNNKYKPANSFDVGQKACKNYCNETAKGMYKVLTQSPEAWNNAKSTRDKNLDASINGVYASVYNRSATIDELDAARQFLTKNRSFENLTAKVKQDYARSVQASISVITQLVLEE